MNHRLTEEAKLQYFQSLLRGETIEFYQSLTITTETNLNDVLTEFRKEFTKITSRKPHYIHGIKLNTIPQQKHIQTS